MTEKPPLNFWFEFASTYSYPAAMRIAPLAKSRGVAVRWRPFLLGPIFKAQGWDNSPFNLYPAKGRYMWRDLERICASLDLPFVQPAQFPQNTLLAARVAIAALSEDWGEDFCRAVFRAEFATGRRIDDPAVIGELLAELNVEAAPLLAAAQSEAVKGRLREETAEAEQRGLFGAPSFTCVDGELFWGNDRLEQALRWAKQANSG